jgi:hypothetical protein
MRLQAVSLAVRFAPTATPLRKGARPIWLYHGHIWEMSRPRRRLLLMAKSLRLVGLAEVAAMLGVTKRTALRNSRRADFLRPWRSWRWGRYGTPTTSKNGTTADRRSDPAAVLGRRLLVHRARSDHVAAQDDRPPALGRGTHALERKRTSGLVGPAPPRSLRSRVAPKPTRPDGEPRTGRRSERCEFVANAREEDPVSSCAAGLR